MKKPTRLRQNAKTMKSVKYPCDGRKIKVISIEELKQGICLETMKQKFLWSDFSRNQLGGYLKSRKECDLLYLVYSVMNRCNLYFKKIVCTYDLWIVDTNLYGESSFCLVYTINTNNNNNLDKRDSIVAYLEHEDGTYFLDFNEYETTVCKERKRQRNHDMEVGRFILQCYVDLLNELLQEVEIWGLQTALEK